jgi:hypothetical protein
MRRKALPKPEPVVDREILETALKAVHTDLLPSDKMKKPVACSVCASPCAPNSTEGLCWVCRRLKISAWRDSDSQAASQE